MSRQLPPRVPPQPVRQLPAPGDLHLHQRIPGQRQPLSAPQPPRRLRAPYATSALPAGQRTACSRAVGQGGAAPSTTIRALAADRPHSYRSTRQAAMPACHRVPRTLELPKRPSQARRVLSAMDPRSRSSTAHRAGVRGTTTASACTHAGKRVWLRTGTYASPVEAVPARGLPRRRTNEKTRFLPPFPTRWVLPALLKPPPPERFPPPPATISESGPAQTLKLLRNRVNGERKEMGIIYRYSSHNAL